MQVEILYMLYIVDGELKFRDSQIFKTLGVLFRKKNTGGVVKDPPLNGHPTGMPKVATNLLQVIAKYKAPLSSSWPSQPAAHQNYPPPGIRTY